MLGLETGENLYLNEDKWEAIYVPQSISMVPFGLGLDPEKENTLTTCIDVDSKFVGEDQDNALFDEKGNDTDFYKGVQESLGGTACGPSSSRKMYFAPYNTPLIGVVDPTDDTYSTINATAQTGGGTTQHLSSYSSTCGHAIGVCQYFSGVVCEGTALIFTPYYGNEVGKFETTTGAFKVVSTVAQGVRGYKKYLGNGVRIGSHVYFVPFNEEHVGVFNFLTDEFSKHARVVGSAGSPGSPRSGGHFWFGVAAGTKLVMAPRNEDNCHGIFETGPGATKARVYELALHNVSPDEQTLRCRTREPLLFDTWQRVTATWDGHTSNIYIDGSLKAGCHAGADRAYKPRIPALSRSSTEITTNTLDSNVPRIFVGMHGGVGGSSANHSFFHGTLKSLMVSSGVREPNMPRRKEVEVGGGQPMLTREAWEYHEMDVTIPTSKPLSAVHWTVNRDQSATRGHLWITKARLTRTEDNTEMIGAEDMFAFGGQPVSTRTAGPAFEVRPLADDLLLPARAALCGGGASVVAETAASGNAYVNLNSSIGENAFAEWAVMVTTPGVYAIRVIHILDGETRLVKLAVNATTLTTTLSLGTSSNGGDITPLAKSRVVRALLNRGRNLVRVTAFGQFAGHRGCRLHALHVEPVRDVPSDGHVVPGTTVRVHVAGRWSARSRCPPRYTAVGPQRVRLLSEGGLVQGWDCDDEGCRVRCDDAIGCEIVSQCMRDAKPIAGSSTFGQGWSHVTTQTQGEAHGMTEGQLAQLRNAETVAVAWSNHRTPETTTSPAVDTHTAVGESLVPTSGLQAWFKSSTITSDDEGNATWPWDSSVNSYVAEPLQSYARPLLGPAITLTIPSTNFGAQAKGVSVTQAISGAAGTLEIALTAGGGLVTTVDALLASADADLKAAIDAGTDVAVAAGDITTDGAGTGLTLKYTSADGSTTNSITVTTAGSGYMIGNKITIAKEGMPGRATDAVFTLVADDITFATSVVVFPTNAIAFNTANAVTVGGFLASTPVPTVVKVGISTRKSVTYTKESGHGAGKPIAAWAGSTSDSVTFGSVIQREYTICSISRYTSASGNHQKRVLQGGEHDLFHGHYNGQVGVARHGPGSDDWATDSTSTIRSQSALTDWVVMCSTNAAAHRAWVNGNQVGLRENSPGKQCHPMPGDGIGGDEVKVGTGFTTFAACEAMVRKTVKGANGVTWQAVGGDGGCYAEIRMDGINVMEGDIRIAVSDYVTCEFGLHDGLSALRNTTTKTVKGSAVVTTLDALVGSSANLVEVITAGTDVAVAAGLISTTGSGTGLALKYTSSAAAITSITVTAGGSGYQIGDTVTIAKAATPTRTTDVTFTLVGDDVLPPSSTLNINTNAIVIEDSAWAVAEVIVWDRPLTNIEMRSVSQYLMSLLGGTIEDVSIEDYDFIALFSPSGIKNATSARDVNSEKSTCAADYTRVAVTCVKGDCGLPAEMYLGTDDFVGCQGLAYGLVSPANARPLPVASAIRGQDPTCVARYWEYDAISKSCVQVCTHANQARDYGTGRCKCGAATPNKECPQDMPCSGGQCIEASDNCDDLQDYSNALYFWRHAGGNGTLHSNRVAATRYQWTCRPQIVLKYVDVTVTNVVDGKSVSVTSKEKVPAGTYWLPECNGVHARDASFLDSRSSPTFVEAGFILEEPPVFETEALCNAAITTGWVAENPKYVCPDDAGDCNSRHADANGQVSLPTTMSLWTYDDGGDFARVNVGASSSNTKSVAVPQQFSMCEPVVAGSEDASFEFVFHGRSIDVARIDTSTGGWTQTLVLNCRTSCTDGGPRCGRSVCPA